MQHVGTQKHYGIDTFVAVVTHENGHKRAYEAIQAGAVDTDHDGLPNSMEAEVGLNPDNPYSSGVLSSEGTPLGDNEAYSHIIMRDVEGPREADWASNGLNAGTVPGPDPANRHPITYFK